MKQLLLLLCLLAALTLTACGTPPADAPAPTGTTTTSSSTAAPTDVPIQLTTEEAEQIAVAHAGLTADAVTELRTEYEIDNGRGKFEVSFRNGDYEYSYDIDAVTGQVISYDRDNERLD